MRNDMKPAKNWLCRVVLVVLHSSFLVLGVPATAQVAGNNAVYNSNGLVQPSTAFIDASKVSQGSDICATIHNILTSQTFVSGTVVDARGIISANPMVCATSPWSGSVRSPSTVLLPAGTIVIPSTLILPSNTKLIGLGYGTTGGTVIQACTTSNCSANFPTGTPMIQTGLGSCSPGVFCDTGVSVENLMLDGFSLNINGIQNGTAQSSHVDHVTMYRILGTGLVVSSQNSGPYTNITFDSGPSALSTTTCANITGPNGLGIHGLTCIVITAANAAVYLDSSSNSIEDVRIAGFLDGVLVGSQGAAQSNVLFNIFGDTIISTNTPSPVNVIHLSTLHTVTDISIMGVNNVGGGSNNTIRDDLTSTTLTDPYVAMYVLGKSANGGYSRFTTSPHAATWGSGASTPSGACGASSAGSLYSNTSGTGAALWVCPVGGGSWAAIR